MTTGTVTFKGINKAGILDALATQQMAQLEAIRPAIESVIRETVGTQYYSESALRLAGYPYRIGGTPPMPPGVINKQTGRFANSIRVIGPTRIGNMVVFNVISLAEDRAWQLGGTEDTIERPYKLLLQARLRRAAAKQFDDITRSTLRIKVSL